MRIACFFCSQFRCIQIFAPPRLPNLTLEKLGKQPNTLSDASRLHGKSFDQALSQLFSP
jgi:hypothetical protein